MDAVQDQIRALVSNDIIIARDLNTIEARHEDAIRQLRTSVEAQESVIRALRREIAGLLRVTGGSPVAPLKPSLQATGIVPVVTREADDGCSSCAHT